MDNLIKNNKFTLGNQFIFYLKNVYNIYIFQIKIWMMNAPKTFTASNNIRFPGFVLVITGISQIWPTFSRDILRQSFIQCGIFQMVLMPIINNFVIL